MLSAILGLVLLGSPTAAVSQIFPAPNPLIIGGMQVRCMGIPVFFDYSLNDMGYASFTPQGPMIRLNPNRLSTVAPVVQVFIFAHECGHLVAAGSNEMAADCWAIQVGKRQRWFGPSNFPYLVATMRNSPGSFTHPPGPARLRHIQNCYNAA